MTAWWSFPGQSWLACITGNHYDWRLTSSCLLCDHYDWRLASSCLLWSKWWVENSFIGAILTFCRSNTWNRAVAPCWCPGLYSGGSDYWHFAIARRIVLDPTVCWWSIYSPVEHSCRVGKILGIVSWQPEDGLAPGIMFLWPRCLVSGIVSSPLWPKGSLSIVQFWLNADVL